MSDFSPFWIRACVAIILSQVWHRACCVEGNRKKLILLFCSCWNRSCVGIVRRSGQQSPEDLEHWAVHSDGIYPGDCSYGYVSMQRRRKWVFGDCKCRSRQNWPNADPYLWDLFPRTIARLHWPTILLRIVPDK